jgi:hypothetical protein
MNLDTILERMSLHPKSLTIHGSSVELRQQLTSDNEMTFFKGKKTNKSNVRHFASDLSY